MNPKHVKVKITQKDGDSTKVTKLGYLEELSSYQEEVEQSKLTSHADLLNDLLGCLKVLKETTTPTLTIVIHRDKYQQPQRMTYTFITDKEYYGNKRS